MPPACAHAGDTWSDTLTLRSTLNEFRITGFSTPVRCGRAWPPREPRALPCQSAKTIVSTTERSFRAHPSSLTALTNRVLVTSAMRRDEAPLVFSPTFECNSPRVKQNGITKGITGAHDPKLPGAHPKDVRARGGTGASAPEPPCAPDKNRVLYFGVSL